jgi:hypothetical protein
MKLVSLVLLVAASFHFAEAGIIKRAIKMPSKLIGKGLGMVGL